jgi:hypothetical protein
VPEAKERRVFVTLTGGLGNQLFQLAAAIYLAQGGPIVCESVDGNPRLNSKLEPQIRCFKLPFNVHFNAKQRKSKIYSKLFGYTLRSGYAPNSFESSKFFKVFIKIVNYFAIFIRTGKPRSYLIASDIGFSPLHPRQAQNHLVGYFQSYKWLEDENTHQNLRGIYLPNFTPTFGYQDLADLERPTLIHVRLTDYISESSFGLLSKTYYEKAIQKLENEGRLKPGDKLWVFSDDIAAAKELLSFIDDDKVRWIVDKEDCPAKTLEVMRMCHNYIISNSTFSWWGATLSHNEGVAVVYPQPWFKGALTPRLLTRESWMPIKSEWR